MTDEPGRPCRIRPATADDLPALGALGGQLVRVHHAFDAQRFLTPPPDVEHGYAWFLGTQLQSTTAAVFVADAEGVVAGYVYAGLEPLSWPELREAAGFIHDVLVVDTARGRGIGTALVEHAIAWLTSCGAPRVMLWTAPQNPSAQRLFARFGFRTTMLEMTREL